MNIAVYTHVHTNLDLLYICIILCTDVIEFKIIIHQVYMCNAHTDIHNTSNQIHFLLNFSFISTNLNE